MKLALREMNETQERTTAARLLRRIVFRCISNFCRFLLGGDTDDGVTYRGQYGGAVEGFDDKSVHAPLLRRLYGIGIKFC